MKTQNTKQIYTSLDVEIVDIKTEAGYAASTGTSGDGENADLTHWN